MSKRILIILLFMMTVWAVQKAQVNTLLYDAYGNYYSCNYTAAIASFDQLISTNVTPRPKDIFYRGISEYNIGNYRRALNDLQLAASKDIVDALLWSARASMNLNDPGSSLNDLREYLLKSPNTDLEEVTKDPLFKSLHNSDGWYSLLENYNKSKTREIIDEARYLAEKQQYDKAHSLIENASYNREIDLVQCNSKIYADEGNFELAVNELNRGLENHPESRVLLKLKAEYLTRLNKSSEAYEIYTRLLEETPEDFPLRFLHAEAALNSGNVSDAKSNIDLYLKYFSTEETLFLAGRIEYVSGRYLNSIKYFNRILEKNTSSAAYFKARGLAYYKTNTFQQAAYDLSMSLDLVPDDAEVNYFLGLTQKSLGNTKMACYYLNRARQYGELKAIEYLQKNCGE